MIRNYGRFLLAPAALFFQVVPALFLYFVPGLVYAAGHTVVETRAWTGSITGLACLALAGLVLASTASYRLLTHSRAVIAWPMILFFCVPSWLLSVFYLHAVLIFLAWV